MEQTGHYQPVPWCFYVLKVNGFGRMKMKKNKKKALKRFFAWICMFSILVSLCTDMKYVYAKNKDNNVNADGSTEENLFQNQKQRAVSWILSGINETGSFGDERLVNDTCAVAALTAFTGDSLPEQTGTWLKEKMKTAGSNHDILVRLFLATGQKELLQELLAGQNQDGGFGLTGEYMSDAPDSVLAFESLVKSTVTDGAYERELALLLSYFAGIQNDDGGFGYTEESGSDCGLSLKLALTAAVYEAYTGKHVDEAWLERLGSYVSENAAFYETDSLWKMQYEYFKAVTNESDVKEGMKWLAEHQEKDGSFSQELQTTVYAVYFMQFLERQNQPYFYGGDMNTLLSSYVLYDGFETDITAETVFQYHTNRQRTGQIRLELLRDGETETVSEGEIMLLSSEETAEFSNTITVKGDGKAEYVFRVTLYVDGEPAGMTEDALKVQSVSVGEPELKAVNAGTEGVWLSWNDISNEFYRYGYRIYRSTENGEFETRSSWDGEEKVRVLNIYPVDWAAAHFKKWMETAVSGTDTPAGRGLFVIDTVHIDEYNRNPDKYLLDETGSYQYDVLYFGAADRYAGKDLNEESYQATRKFAESGRGILFGHDTVTIASNVTHPVFGRFGELLGIQLKNGSTVEAVTQVKVVNMGFLTSYPWKIEGILTIPASHALEQYTGGDTKAEVWMEFVSGGACDEERDTKANAYLFSSNQLAMIQTGHSNGKATDDERKVLANTLFYLKQLTEDSQALDKSAYDIKPPVISKDAELERKGELLEISVSAQDYGTDYRYYIEALPQGNETADLRRESNTAEITVTSGLAGYFVCVNESDSMGTEPGGLELIRPEDGLIRYELPETEAGKKYYLHIWAADLAGNVSDELVLEVLEEKSAQPDIYGTGYGLFGTEDVTAYIGELTVKQDVYSGGNVTCAGSGVTIGGTVSAAGQINLYTGNKATGEQTEYSEEKEMPQLHEGILADMGGQDNIEVLNIYESTQTDHPTWCATTTGAYCPEFILNAPLVCDNTVNTGAGSVICGQDKDITLYSVNGDININASELKGRGLIYAPNGTVTINVQNMQFAGSIIAKRIMIQGTTLQIGQENTDAE